MNRFATVFALLLALMLPATARADEASQRAKAEQVIILLHTEKTIQQIAANITAQIDTAADRAGGSDATPEQKAKIDDFKKQVSQWIDSSLGWAAMKPAVVDLYVKSFTEDQLDGIIAFYKTPAGAALLEKMPDINNQFGQLGNARIAGLRDQLQKSYQDLQNSLHAAPTLGAPSSTPAPAASGSPK